MGKKKGKGGKRKRRGKKMGNGEKRKIEFKEDGQEYARVLKMLGDGRLEARCSDDETRICHIRGKMRKRVWIKKGDLVLVEVRSFQQDKADVIHKYNDDEDRTLQSYGELTGGTIKDENDETIDEEVKFGGDYDSNESESDEDVKDLETALQNL